MLTKVSTILATAAFGAVMLLGGTNTAFAGVLCAGTNPNGWDTDDAVANGSSADACYSSVFSPTGEASETTYINAIPGWTPDNFTFIGKMNSGGTYEQGGAPAGWSITGATPADSNYMHGFTVHGPVSPIDFVLGVKEGRDHYVAYKFLGASLAINGAFNNIYLNNSNNPVNGFSHISGFFRTTEDTNPCEVGQCFPVPEPGALALLGVGLLGLGLSRRRIELQKA